SKPKSSLPNRTPVHPAFTLAFELCTKASHPPPALRANPIQNAGEHFLRRFEPPQSDKRHISPRQTACVASIIPSVRRHPPVPAGSNATKRESLTLANALALPKRGKIRSLKRNRRVTAP